MREEREVETVDGKKQKQEMSGRRDGEERAELG
jgi:hypothetical protein